MTDSETRETEAVPTTSFLPDHLVAGGQAGIGSAGTDEPSADGDGGGDDAASEFCRTWRSHLAGSRSKSPF